MLPSLTAPPTDPHRIRSLDFLRGIALLGILLVNIQSFALPLDSRENPTLFGDFHGLNFFAWTFTYLFADEKFVSIFAILFGAGILLQGHSAQQKNLSPAAIHYKRMTILLLLGLAHAYLLWYGDILFSYAICGMLLYPIRNLPAKTLLPLALLLIAGHTLFTYSLTHQFAPSQHLVDLFYRQTDGLDIPSEITAYRGNWLAQMHHRVPTTFATQTTIFFMWTLWRCGGCILLGMALHKWNTFTPSVRRTRTYLLLALLLIPLGTALSTYSINLNIHTNWDPDIIAFQSSQFHYWGSLLTALGYITLLIPLTKFAATAISSIGRTALSNYLLQTLLCTTLFYGHGFDYFAKLSRFELLELVPLIWLFQLLLTTLYLRRFNRGPLEWAWHRIVYHPWWFRAAA